MSDLSNQPGLVLRAARATELEAALRLVLATERGLADDAQVLDFLQFAAQRHLDLQALRIAEQSGKIRWAILPLASPGRTMMLFAPATPPDPHQQSAAKALTQEILRDYYHREIDLAQVLIDPTHLDYRELYRDCGFWELAELVYLQRNISHRSPFPPTPAGLELHTYSLDLDALFKETILQTYQQSMDCPRLTGLRNVDDIVAGHRATGDFDPLYWFVLTESGQGRGVLLLSRTPRSDAMELVYLGLHPEARGRGLGRWFMQQAIACVGRAGLNRLCLAVDSLNVPALRLYYSFGMTRVGSRLAMLCDLRNKNS